MHCLSPLRIGYSTDGAIWDGSERYVGDGVWVIDQKMTFSALSVGSARNVYAISDGQLYHYLSDDLHQIDASQSIVYISVSASDGSVWGLDQQGNAHIYNPTKDTWSAAPAGTPQFRQISVLDANNVLGTSITSDLGNPLQRWDGTSWSKVTFGSPSTAAAVTHTRFACAVRESGGAFDVFTIDDWKDQNHVLQRSIFHTAKSDGLWLDKYRKQLNGMMMKLSAGIDSSGNITLWGWNDGDTYNGVYSYDFNADKWNLVSADGTAPAAIGGGGFVLSGYGSGQESVLRSEIGGAWTTVPMPIRTNANVLSARNAKSFYTASSEGVCYRWRGLGWMSVSQPAGTTLTGVSVTGGDYSVWVIDSTGVIWELVDNAWQSHGGTFNYISANRAGHAYAVTSDGCSIAKLYRLSAESAAWTEVPLPTSTFPGAKGPNAYLQVFAASMDDTCTVTDARGDLCVYNPASGEWTVAAQSGQDFGQLSAQDENHLVGSVYYGLWIMSEAAPLPVAATQEWDDGGLPDDWFPFP
jgi:hypothetical protein